MTLAQFVAEAAHASGGMEALGRRMGLSRPTVERMSVSDQPLLTDDATALLEVFGLSPHRAGELPVHGGRGGASARD